MSQKSLDDIIHLALTTQRLIAEPETGKIYRTREKSTKRQVEPYEVVGRFRKGYRAINVSINGTNYTLSAHRIIWIAKHGIPEDGSVINHKNFDRTDNRIENLEMVTHAINLSYSLCHGRLTVIGEGNGSAKLTQAQVDAIREEYSPYKVTNKMLAKKYDVSPVTIAKVTCGISWKHSLPTQVEG